MIISEYLGHVVSFDSCKVLDQRRRNFVFGSTILQRDFLQN